MFHKEINGFHRAHNVFHMEIISFASGNRLFVIRKSIVFIRKSMVLHREIRGFSKGNPRFFIGRTMVCRREII